MSGERLLVLASPGFLAEASGEAGKTGRILDLAARHHVTISALDPRGIYTDRFDLSESGEPSELERRYYRQSAAANGDVLTTLADGAGGIFFRKNNDLDIGLGRVTDPPRFSYILAFSPVSLKMDGKFHSIKIKLSNGKGATIQARRGYFASLQESGSEEKLEADIHDAVFSQEELGDVPMDIHIQLVKGTSQETQMTAIAKIGLQWLSLKKSAGRNNASFIVVSSLFDNDGNYLTGTTQTVHLQLRDETLRHPNPAISVPSVFSVKPGRYRVRFVLHQEEGSGISARNGEVEVR